METTETRDHQPRGTHKSPLFRFWPAQRFLSLGPLGLAFIQGACAATVLLSGVRTALGFSSLVAAAAAGPATGFHANSIRIPMLTLAGIGAVVNLFLFWNAERLRRNPSARWRMRPLTRRERLGRRMQIGTSLLTLFLIAAELFAHTLFHHEM
jgi:ABC-type uncharacterized transport system permease subunit